MISAKENSLELLLADFSNQYKKKRNNVKIKVKTDITLKERAKLGIEMLAKQRPFTLSQMRAQALSVQMSGVSRNRKIIGTGNHNLDNAIKYNLRMYFPKLSDGQIEDGLIKLYSIYNAQQDKTK